MLILHKSDAGRTVSVAVGDRFSLELEENRATGYAWSEPEFDEKGLVLESNDPVPAAGPAVGGAGLRRFVFQVKTPGRGSVRTQYKRSWETDAPPSSRFEITVVRS